jgi:hypothetical protein
MKFSIIALALLAGSVMTSSVALANADDAKWIAQCVRDNKDEGPSQDVISKYCTCMDGKMGDSETQSITQWEKSHPTEQKACSAEAGWK